MNTGPGVTGGQGSLAISMTRGTAMVAVQRGVEAVVGLFLVPFTLTMLGQDAYGLWALFYSVVMYLNLADMGFSAALNYHFVQAIQRGDDEEKRRVFSSSLAFLTAVGVLMLLAGLAGEPLLLHFFREIRPFGDTARWVWRAMLLILLFGFLGSYARSLFYASHRVAKLSLLNTTLSVFNAVATVIVLLAGWRLVGLAAAGVLVAVVRLVVLMSVGVRGVAGWNVGLNGVRKATIARLWSFGLRVFVARVAELIYFTFDRLIIGRMIGLGGVTSYDVGAKAGAMANQVPLVVLPVLEPAAASLHAEGRSEAFARLVHRSSRYMALLAFGLMGYLLVNSRPLLALWLGELRDERVVLTLRVIALAYMTASLTGPLRVSSRGAGFPGWEAKSAALQASLNVLLSILLYLRYGFTGVVFGTLAATLIGQGLYTVLALRGLKLRAWPFLAGSWGRPLIAAVGAAVATNFVFRWLAVGPIATRVEALLPVVALTAVYGAVFAALAFLLRALTRTEVGDLWGHLRGRAS